MSGSTNLSNDEGDTVRQDELRGSDEAPPLKRRNASMNVTAGKGIPANYADLIEDSDECEVPDLADYFNAFDVAYDQQIRICRAYASYLAAQLPKKERKTN